MKPWFFLCLAALIPAAAGADIYGSACERVNAEQSVVASLIPEVLAKADSHRPVLACRIARGDWTLPVFVVTKLADGTSMIVFSQEIEDILVTQEIRGMIGHEAAHMFVDSFDQKAVTDVQKLEQEVRADAFASVLVGADAVRQGMTGFHELYERMATRGIALQRRQIELRLKRLNETPAVP